MTEDTKNAAKLPAFRHIRQQDGTGMWIGFAGDDFMAKFVYESDAIAWRAADPLNHGTLDQLLERKEQREDQADSLPVQRLRASIKDLEERAVNSPRRGSIERMIVELKATLAQHLGS